MFRSMALGKDRASVKIAAANVILVANAFIWYLIAFNSLKVLISNADIHQLTNAYDFRCQHRCNCHRRVNRHIYCWQIYTASTLSLCLDSKRYSIITITTWPLMLPILTQITILSIVFGAYFGLGMPATMGYHSSSSSKLRAEQKLAV